MGKGGTSLLCAVVITLGACSSSHRATDPPTIGPARTSTSAARVARPGRLPRTATTTARRAPTASKPAPAFSFDGSVPPPEIVDTGTDYVAILGSLERYGNWLGAHRPDPALAATTVAPGTRVFTTYVNELTGLRDNHKRIIETLDGPTTYTILSATPDAFSARVVEHIVRHYTVDAAGHVTSERRFVGPTTYIDVVVLAHSRWYLAAFDEQRSAVVHL